MANQLLVIIRVVNVIKVQIKSHVYDLPILLEPSIYRYFHDDL